MDHQRAVVDGRRAGVKIRSGQRLRAGAGFGQADRPRSILNHAREAAATIAAADRQRGRACDAAGHGASSSKRTDGFRTGVEVEERAARDGDGGTIGDGVGRSDRAAVVQAHDLSRSEGRLINVDIVNQLGEPLHTTTSWGRTHGKDVGDALAIGCADENAISIEGGRRA